MTEQPGGPSERAVEVARAEVGRLTTNGGIGPIPAEVWDRSEDMKGLWLRQRDEARARADRAEAALRLIADHAGQCAEWARDEQRGRQAAQFGTLRDEALAALAGPPP